MNSRFAAFLGYFCLMFVITFIFTGWMVLIWWATQYGYWWSTAAVAFGIAVIGGVMLTFKDPAKVKK